jgi:hypothetical protein
MRANLPSKRSFAKTTLPGARFARKTKTRRSARSVRKRLAGKTGLKLPFSADLARVGLVIRAFSVCGDAR